MKVELISRSDVYPDELCGEAAAPESASGGKKKFVCKICGYVYEGETLPADFVCPICKHGTGDFEEIQ